jgi:hypothetical protein
MAVTVASIAPFVPIIQLLGKIIEYLTELQKNSKKHSEALAEIKTALAQLKKMLEEEIEARKRGARAIGGRPSFHPQTSVWGCGSRM